MKLEYQRQLHWPASMDALNSKATNNGWLIAMSNAMLVHTGFGMGLLGFTASVACLPGNKDLNHTSSYQFLGSTGMTFPITAGLSPGVFLRGLFLWWSSSSPLASDSSFSNCMHMSTVWSISTTCGLSQQMGTWIIAFSLVQEPWAASLLSSISLPLIASVLIRLITSKAASRGFSLYQLLTYSQFLTLLSNFYHTDQSQEVIHKK